jgi:penicillin-binding protein 1A
MISPYKKVKILWISFFSLLLLFLFFIFSVSINLFSLFGEIPDTEVLENPKSEIASEVYSSDNVMLVKYYSNFNRSPVEFKDLPENLKNALIATEDVRFRKHSGIDIKGIMAIPFALLTGQKRGSSTITQQLVKNLFKTRISEKYQGPLGRNIIATKVKEWIAAIRLECAYTKDEILLMYLNTVDFGSLSFGIKSSARTYFNTTPEKLKVEQSALLIGLLKGPSYYSPVRHPERALNRRNTVLSQMVKYNYLSEEAFNSLKQIPISLKYTNQAENVGLAPYFTNSIKSHVMKLCHEKGFDLYEDGLKIYTTIDSRMQMYAEESMRKHMSFLQKEFFAHWKGRAPWTDIKHKEIKGFIEKAAKKSDRYKLLKEELGDDENAIWAEMKKPVRMRVFTWNGGKDTTLSPMDSIKYSLHFLHMGFMSMDPQNGYVKAWIGDIDNRFFKYDHVKQGARQPGSAFKPIIYSYALENGYTPCSIVYDVPVTFAMPGGESWTPKNSHGSATGQPLTLKQALAESINTVSAYLMQQFGPEPIVELAKKFGITSELDPVPPLCLGTSDVSVFDLTTAYSVFVNHGIRVDPIFITRIEDKNGNVIVEMEKSEPSRVISEESAYAMVQMLKGTTEESTGTAVSLKTVYHLPYEVGGKTGTTQSSSDGWFMGITPGLVTGIWVGGENRAIRFRNMTLGQGAKMALPMFGYYMQKVYDDYSFGIPVGNFLKPESVNIQTNCAASDTLDFSSPSDSLSNFDSTLYDYNKNKDPDFGEDW